MSNMVHYDQVPLRDLWINYAYLGMDEGWPVSEAVGTLIQTMSHGYIIKTSDTHGRTATPEEMSSWSGPVSPSWWRGPSGAPR